MSEEFESNVRKEDEIFSIVVRKEVYKCYSKIDSS
jgi:hypothetical protein